MKRNWDLIRELLHSVEIMDQAENEYGRNPKDKFIGDWSYFDPQINFVTNNYEFIERKARLEYDHKPEVQHHLKLIYDANLVSCSEFNQDNPILSLSKMTLTMQGYDLLGIMDYRDLWKQIQDKLEKNSLPLTVFSIMELGKQLTLNKIKVIE